MNLSKSEATECKASGALPSRRPCEQGCESLRMQSGSSPGKLPAETSEGRDLRTPDSSSMVGFLSPFEIKTQVRT